MEQPRAFILSIADRTVVLSRSGNPIREPIDVHVRGDAANQLILTGLSAGAWNVRAKDGSVRSNIDVLPRRNTAFLVVPAGDYTVTPGRIDGAPDYAAATHPVPRKARALTHCIVSDNRLLDCPPSRAGENRTLLPAVELSELLGATAAASGRTLQIEAGKRIAVFAAGRSTFELNGHTFRMPDAAVQEDGSWFVPDATLAPLLDRGVTGNHDGNDVELTTLRIPSGDKILWIESDDRTDPGCLPLHAMLADVPGRKEYWAAKGKGVGFGIVLTEPCRIAGVGIIWHQGDMRRATFCIETSVDGQTWSEAFEGESSGTTAALERYSFEPREARGVRFRGFGNTKNQWNSLVHFRLFPR